MRALGQHGHTRMPPAPARVIVVAGASSGIGRATALACARRRDDLVLVARAETPLRDVAAECARLGARTLVVPADVSDEDAVRRVLASALETYGRVDGWVHSAAVMAYGRVEDVPAEVFDRVVTTDLLGVVNVARVLLPRLRRQHGGGTLVVIGSLLGTTVAPLMGAYVTSKWGVQGLVRVLRLETRDAREVHVCSVSPAGVDTPIYLQAANYTGKAGRPPPPVDSPERVARAVLRSLDHPRRERVVGPTSRVIRLAFTLLPGAYDLAVGPLLQFAALSRDDVRATAGNVLAPAPDGDALHGRWGRHWLRPVGAAGTVAALGAAGVARAARSSRRERRGSC